MEIACPACNKANKAETQCIRCGADLIALVQIRRCATLALKTGAQCLKQRDGRGALHQAEISWHLKKSAEAARLAFLACLYLQRFASATRWYELALSRESKPQGSIS
ncbi:hypothetical protein ACFL0Q_05325 [Thermodesulfobacteriota bacterium]